MQDSLANAINPTVLVFDSGLGGLTVLREIAALRKDLKLVYAADDAAFPYGALDDTALVARVDQVMDDLIARFKPDLVVIACNTASTLTLPVLRAKHQIPFVGTVPAIKPACAQSKTKRISVLATPGTVKRDYTRDLIREFAADCRVELVGCPNIAPQAERAARGLTYQPDRFRDEILPAFIDEDGRTDTVVLACTHFPLVLYHLQQYAPWPVTWIDPAPAIARRVVSLLPKESQQAQLFHQVLFTSGIEPDLDLHSALSSYGLNAPYKAPPDHFPRENLD